jgi:hypothetical protein
MVFTFYRTLFVLFTVVALCHAFITTPEIKSRGASSCSSPTEIRMGLFDKKPAAKKSSKKEDNGWLAGGGSRITIREDEDNAMWIDEPKEKKPVKKGK